MSAKTKRVLRLGQIQDDGLDCRSPIRVIQDELDTVISRLMADEAEDGDPNYARGLTFALAVLEDPWQPDAGETKNRAMLRWEALYAEDEEGEDEDPDPED